MYRYLLVICLPVPACSAPEVIDRHRSDPALADALGASINASAKSECFEDWGVDGRQFFVMGTPDDLPEVTEPTSDLHHFGLLEVAIPKFSSKPGALKTVYLDFDGHLTTGGRWNQFKGGADIVTPPYDTDGDPGSLSAAESANIRRIWRLVADDFVPFDVNVTTVEPAPGALTKSGAGDTSWGVRVAIGGSSADWFGGSVGGVAFIGSFNWDSGEPAFIFPAQLGNGDPKYTGEAVSHETGHTLGLIHQGNATTSYYEGSGTGVTSWAPIMGVPYNGSLTTWSRGIDEKSGTVLNGDTDEINTILTGNGIRLRPDDVGETIASAKPLSVAENAFAQAGLIGSGTDVDMFKLTAGEGVLTLSANPVSSTTDLDVGVTLFDAQGQVVAEDKAEDDADLNASITRNVTAGTYYIAIKPHPHYGRLGRYSLSGTLASGSGLNSVAPVASFNDDAEALVASFNEDPVAPTDSLVVAAVSAPAVTFSGTIRFQGEALVGALVDSGFGVTAQSDGSGTYSFANVVQGTDYAIIPQKVGYVFTPSSIRGTVEAASRTSGLNFQATCARGYTRTLEPLSCTRTTKLVKP